MNDNIFTLRKMYNLPARQAELLHLLLNNRYVSSTMIEIQFKIYTDAKVAVHKLRRLLSPFQITIEVMRGAGYYLTDDDRRKMWTSIASQPKIGST
jgi:DNA-binding response OmpR family regulator